MPREIADSDGESDFASPKRPSASPIPENNVDAIPLSTLEQDPFANLEFDQFLSPTQRLSSALERLDAAHPHSTSSTDQFLQDIAQVDHGLLNSTANTLGFDGSLEESTGLQPRGKAKRSLSDIEGGKARNTQDKDVRQKSAKRTKTYGSTNTQRSDTHSLFSDPLNDDLSRGRRTPAAELLEKDTNASTELPVQPLINPNEVESQVSDEIRRNDRSNSYQQWGATSFLQSNIQNTSISNSLTGGYRGINMDFRGAGLSIDGHANPFGSLSQVSLDADVNQSQTERFASLFHHSQEATPDVLTDSNLQRSHLKEMATSPVETLDQARHDVISQHHKNEPTTESTKAVPKKRGRKPKNIQATESVLPSQTDVFEQLQSDDPLDMPSEKYQPRPSRSRAGTVDSVGSHVSHESLSTDNSKRKRKRSTVPEPVEGDKHNFPGSELNLSDPAMIGAPKEMYAPRPSKSRSKRVIETEDEPDELQMDEPSKVDEKSSTSLPNEVLEQPGELMPPPSNKKKAGKKSKVKRAKTSAAAVLKSADMYDEEDRDCIIVDEMPAKVKIGHLAEISPVKQETKMDDSTVRDEKKISIDILPSLEPSHLDTTKPGPEPKKRGRKPKKKPAVQIQDDNSGDTLINKHAENTEISRSDTTRPALSEKDPNTTPPNPSLEASTPLSKQPSIDQEVLPSPSTSPKKPVHSPLNPASRSNSSTPLPPNSTSSTRWVKPRVGLSRRLTIPSLLRKLDRTKEPPKVTERKEKLSKRQLEEEEKRKLEAEDAGEDYDARSKWEMRGKDGLLLEWDD